MPWVRIDEHALNHVKILALSHGAFRLWVEGLAHCQKHLTDGAISFSAVRTFRYSNQSRLGELELAGLWHQSPGGFTVHDYLEWNESRQKVLRDREKSRERFARFQRKKNAVANEEATRLHNHYHGDPKNQDHTVPREAFAGKVLRIPKFLDAEFVSRLNGQYFDLSGFYLALDSRLAQTGEPWDLRWIRDRFAEESPQPQRVNGRAKAQPLPRVTPEQAAAIDTRAVERATAERDAESLAAELLHLWPDDERLACEAEVTGNLTRSFPNLKLTAAMLERSMVQEIIDRYKGRLPETVAALRRQVVAS